MHGMHCDTMGGRARGRALYPWRLALRIGCDGNNSGDKTRERGELKNSRFESDLGSDRYTIIS